MVAADFNIPDPAVETALSAVKDPEVPVLSIFDLGVVREVEVRDKHVAIKLTPTYSGCPAMDTIAMDIRTELAAIGYTCQIEMVLSPAWSTDWISEEGCRKLEEYGIASPLSAEMDKRVLLEGERLLPCPQCKSTNTKMISQFGSTACKALFRCEDCLETFDYFKCLK